MMTECGPSKSKCDQTWLNGLKDVFDWADDLIFVVDVSLFIRYINISAAASFGTSQAEIIGKHLRQFLAPPSYVFFRQYLLSAFQSSEASAFEEKILFSRTELWLDARLTPISNETGKAAAVLVICRDDTERMRSEERILRAKQELQRAVDGISYLLAIVDDRHRISRINSAMAKMLGISVREAAGKLCYQTLHGIERPLPFCPLLQSITNGEEHDIEIHEKHLGEDFLVKLSSLHDNQGKLVGCIYMARKVGERERALDARRKSEEYMKLLLKQADYVTAVQDRDGKYLFFTATPEYGLCPEDIIGRTPFDFFDAAKASKLVERVMRVAASGKPLSQLNELTWNGETLSFFEQIYPIRNSDQEVQTVVTVSRTIRRLEANLPLPAEAAHVGLTRREAQILKLIAAGLTNREIAEQLFISIKTVATHRSRMMQKLDIHRTSGLVEYAIKTGLC